MDITKLKAACEVCRDCALCDTRKNVVFGDGNPNSEVMFIGEGPGEQEDIQGLPFVGPAGQLLDDMLEMIYLDRSRVYIANIVKCRPPRNRDPLAVEKDACIHWLREQMELVSPKIIVCLGRIAATELISEDFKITKEHGQWFQKDGIQIMAIYHPSALLRDPLKRPETFVDLKALQKAIKEISPKTYEGR